MPGVKYIRGNPVNHPDAACYNSHHISYNIKTDRNPRPTAESAQSYIKQNQSRTTGGTNKEILRTKGDNCGLNSSSLNCCNEGDGRNGMGEKIVIKGTWLSELCQSKGNNSISYLDSEAFVVDWLRIRGFSVRHCFAPCLVFCRFNALVCLLFLRWTSLGALFLCVDVFRVVIFFACLK